MDENAGNTEKTRWGVGVLSGLLGQPHASGDIFQRARVSNYGTTETGRIFVRFSLGSLFLGFF